MNCVLSNTIQLILIFSFLRPEGAKNLFQVFQLPQAVEKPLIVLLADLEAKKNLYVGFSAARRQKKP